MQAVNETVCDEVLKCQIEVELDRLGVLDTDLVDGGIAVWDVQQGVVEVADLACSWYCPAAPALAALRQIAGHEGDDADQRNYEACWDAFPSGSNEAPEGWVDQ